MPNPLFYMLIMDAHSNFEQHLSDTFKIILDENAGPDLGVVPQVSPWPGGINGDVLNALIWHQSSCPNTSSQ